MIIRVIYFFSPLFAGEMIVMAKKLFTRKPDRDDVVLMKTRGQQKAKDAPWSFPRRRRGNNYNLYRLINTIGVFIIIGLLIVIGTQYLKYQKVQQELADFEKRVSDYKLRQAAVEEEIERLQNLDYIEALARERLGLVKPGEIIFQLED